MQGVCYVLHLVGTLWDSARGMRVVMSGIFRTEDDNITRISGVLALEAALTVEEGSVFMVEGGEEAPVRMTKKGYY
jgi:hypothetical protein